MNSVTLDLQTETFHSPSSAVLDFSSEHPYDLPGRSQTSPRIMPSSGGFGAGEVAWVIDDDDDDDISQQIQRNLEGDSDASPSVISIERNLDSYTTKRIPVTHPLGIDKDNDGDERDANDGVNCYYNFNEESCESVESAQLVEPAQLVDLQNVQNDIDPQFIHSMPVLTPMTNAGTHNPNDSNVIVLPAPQTHVVHCGNLQLTQQDIQQIQQQIQHRLLNQTIATASPPVHLPPQQYVILGTVGPNTSPQYITGFPVSNNPTVQQSAIPMLQSMTHIQPHPSPNVDTDVIPSSTNTIAATTVSANILSKPTSTLTKAPLSIGSSQSYIKLHTPSNEETVAELEELQKFAKHFKQRRVELGFTQGDVGSALGKSFPNDFSQTTISRFEASNLSPQNMRKLKPLLERWLEDQQQVSMNYISDTFGGRMSPDGASDSKRRKKRTTIEDNVRDLLELSFQSNPKPNASSLTKIANEHNIERDVVRVWFCNRRQREKRLPKYPIIIQNQPMYHPNFIRTDNHGHQTGQTSKTHKSNNKKANRETTNREIEEANATISAAMMSPQGHVIQGFVRPTIFHNS